MHLTPEQEADEQVLRDKETGAQLEVVNKVRRQMVAPHPPWFGCCAVAMHESPEQQCAALSRSAESSGGASTAWATAAACIRGHAQEMCIWTAWATCRPVAVQESLLEWLANNYKKVGRSSEQLPHVFSHVGV
jgi:hypothetical protein